MDHSKTAFPRLKVCNKMKSSLGQLLITLMGMIMHGHGDERYAQQSNKLWPNNLNFTIGSLLWLLWILEVAPISKLKLLFEHPPQISSLHVGCKGNRVTYMNYAL